MEMRFIQAVGACVMPVLGILWLVFFLRIMFAQRRAFLQMHIDISEAYRNALKEALQPVPEEEPEKKVPATWAEYQADLWRMADGRISIEEFVDKWRRREKPKRPTAAELAAAAAKAAELEGRARMEQRARMSAALTFGCHGATGIAGPYGWAGATGIAGVTGIACPMPAGVFRTPSVPAFNIGEWLRIVWRESTFFGRLGRVVDIRMVDGHAPLYRLEIGPNELTDAARQDVEHAHPMAGETWVRGGCSRHGEGSTPWKLGVDAPDMAWAVRCGCLRPVNFGKGDEQLHELKKLKKLMEGSGDEVFNTINTVIREFSKGMADMVDLKKLEALTPEAEAQAAAMGPAERFPRFKQDQWVRFEKDRMPPGDPLAGRLGRIARIHPFISHCAPTYRVEILFGEYTTAPEEWLSFAVPRKGEWWRWDYAECDFECDEDWPANPHVVGKVKDGHLFPVDFGRGAAAA